MNAVSKFLGYLYKPRELTTKLKKKGNYMVHNIVSNFETSVELVMLIKMCSI